MNKKTKHRSSSDRGQRVIDAIKELHESLYDIWNKEDWTAGRAVAAVLADMKKITVDDGDEIEGWSGGVIRQADIVCAALELLDLSCGIKPE